MRGVMDMVSLKAPKFFLKEESWSSHCMPSFKTSFYSSSFYLGYEAQFENGRRFPQVIASASGKSPFQSGIIIPSGVQATTPELYLPFRPPAEKSGASSLSQEEQFQVLRERRGLWHEYAEVVSLLLRAGFSPSTLDEITGVTGVEQNTIVVGAQVFNSIKASGLGPEYLAYFDAGGAEILYEIRTLSAEQRKAAAEYIVEERLDARGGREVSRAIKEYERRKREEGHEAFSNHPGDCLAFNFYRQSKEYRAASQRRAALTKGLEKAVTDSARERLESALFAGEESSVIQKKEVAKKTAARIEAIRLVEDETTFRPIPVLGALEELDEASVVANLADSALEGPFKVFRPAFGTQWMALPLWPILVGSTAPAAIPVADISRLPSFSSTSALQGMLVIERSPQEEQPKAECFYVVPKESSERGLTLLSGGFLAQSGKKALAKVLLVILPALPPQPDQPEDWE